MLNGEENGGREAASNGASTPWIREAGVSNDGIKELLKAYHYAQVVQRETWDFAVEIRTLREAGLTDADFRWLTCQGYVDHACEVTVLGNDGRHFERTGKLSFAKRTCFVLTTAGEAFARSLLDGDSRSRLVIAADAPAHQSGHPTWDPQRRELRFGGALVKQFKWPAINQEMILCAFAEEGWPARIDDPLPPQPEQDSKRRLSDTIKCLNRKQQNRLMHFRSDGTGEGVIWEAAASP